MSRHCDRCNAEIVRTGTAGQALRAYRESRRWTRRRLMEALGLVVDETTVWRWETGRSRVPEAVLAAVRPAPGPRAGLPYDAGHGGETERSPGV